MAKRPRRREIRQQRAFKQGMRGAAYFELPIPPKSTIIDLRPRKVCAQPGCNRLIPPTWGERPFCAHRSCSDKQRENPLFWAYQEQRMLREQATSRRCSAEYYAKTRAKHEAWSRNLEEIALQRIAADQAFIDELRSKGDELSRLIEEQERDARTYRFGQGRVSLSAPVPGLPAYSYGDLIDQDGQVARKKWESA